MTLFGFALVLLPAAVLLAFILKAEVGALLLVVAALVMPVGAALFYVFEPEPATETEYVVLDPGREWSRAECYHKRGVQLLFIDTRRSTPVGWWVKCNDGSKAGVVMKGTTPPGRGYYVDPTEPVI